MTLLMPPKTPLRHAEAMAILQERSAPKTRIERVALAEASGRFLAKDVAAPRPIPGHDNAAVDGFAFAHDGYNPAQGVRLRLAGESAAGSPFSGKVGAAETVLIFTGAVMPNGTDSVAMAEDADIETQGGDSFVTIPAGLEAGANVRLAGEDCRAGERLIEAGQRLRPQDIAAAAAAGLGRLDVFAPLKVGLLSSGDEILEPGADFVPGGVYDANRPMLHGLVRNAGADASDLGVLADDASHVRKRLAEAAARHAALIVTGGASKSQQDHVARAIAELGELDLWHLAIKPGRPMSFGRIGDCAVFGLPGNPVAVFVCFLVYVWPVLRRLGGMAWCEAPRYPVPAGFSLTKKAGRREFWRGGLTLCDGRLVATKYPRDGSGLIASLRQSDGLIEVPEEVTAVSEGDLVSLIAYTDFGIV
jgi:molybdopterin molybdotransferase